MTFDPTPDDVRRHMLADRLSGPVDDNWKFPFANLGEFIEHLIRTSMKLRSSSAWMAEAATDDAWAIELCLGPLSARVMRGTIVEMVFTASDEAGPPPGLRVVTVLSLPVILAAADLALDTEQHENATTQPVSRSGQTAGNENGTLPGVPPRPPRTKTPTADPEDRRHSVIRREREQQAPVRGPATHRGFPPPIEGPRP